MTRYMIYVGVYSLFPLATVLAASVGSYFVAGILLFVSMAAFALLVNMMVGA